MNRKRYGARVDAYRNLNDGCLSIRSREIESENYGRVIDHTDAVLLDDPTFVVQEAGRDRVRETGVKNVHAMVRGIVIGTGQDAATGWWSRTQTYPQHDICSVDYDPYEMDGFEVVEINTDNHDMSVGNTIDSAMYALVMTDGVRVMTGSRNC